MAQRHLLEMAVAGLWAAVVGVVGLPRELERRHEANAFGDARRPLCLGKILDALAPDRGRFLGSIVGVLGDAL